MIAVIVPSRGRPQNIVELIEAWRLHTCHHASLYVVVDDNEPKLDEYRCLDLHGVALWTLPAGVSRLGGALNHVAPVLAKTYDAIGFMGDDHRPRTDAWDAVIDAAFEHAPGAVIYGNDLLQGEVLPTAVFMDARIVRTLGHFVLPGQIHLFMDNYWKTLGQQLGTLRYLPDVIIEHMHPLAGKAPDDAGYAEANSGANWENDERIYKEWVATQMPADIARVKAALS